ncbi:hypothetical protein [Burkholderia vietnamiensis]|uniref:hypothetical protein n=1 Tax=Burkholderia vietnamiensis TaxID=60552 RepID=UPI002010CD90|nr:hypothetical protein [Burkholderia vietnamiensis]
MTTTHSRADALTDQAITEIYRSAYGYAPAPHEIELVRAVERAIRTAFPVLQPAAAPIARLDPDAVTRLKAICRKLGIESTIPGEVYGDPEGLFVIFGRVRDAINRMMGPTPSPSGALHALRAAKQFIANGVELGYIRMPDSDCPDPAHEVPNLIDAAISSLSTASSPADERAAFEAWAREEPFDLSMVGSIYTDSETCAAWHGWRTRAASANKTGAEGAKYEALEREHLGDPDKHTGIYSSSPAMAEEAVGWFDKALNQIRWRDGLVNADFRDGQPFYTQPAQADVREEAYVAKRMAEMLATVYATIVGDDQVDENDGLNAIQRCERAAQVLRLEVELYRGQADARVGLTERFIADFGHRLATLLKIDAFDIADRDAQILALLQGANHAE